MNIQSNKARTSLIIWVALAALLVLYGGLLAKKITLTTADIGRHIKNGEILLATGSPPKTNLYSYTEPDYPIVCHHWGSSAIHYLLWRIGGFELLSVFNILLYILALAILFGVAKGSSNGYWALFTMVLSLPLIILRNEVRPETFSYLLIAVYLWILQNITRQTKPIWWIYAIPLLQIIWVNAHFYFFVGPMIAVLYYMIARRDQKPRSIIRALGTVTAASILSCFLNPSFVSGALVPLSAFKPVAIRVRELQSIFTDVQKGTMNLFYIYFLILFCIVISAWLVQLVQRRAGSNRLPIFFLIIFGAMACFTIRALSLFAIFFIPYAASLAHGFDRRLIGAGQRWFRRVCFTTAVTIIVICVFLWGSALWAKGQFGIGLMPGMNASADYFRKNKIRGPIFNDFNIGAYLIFHFYPSERVFVDSRIEAYPDNFFKNVYLPMLEDENVWKRESRRYGFNSIYFEVDENDAAYRPFIERRIKDPEWETVFKDRFSILLKRTPDAVRHAP